MLITVDFLSFRVRSVPDDDIFSFLGVFEQLEWRVGGACYNNYPDSLHYGHITIGINGTNGFDFYVNMSGQGCREFEDLMPDGWTWEQFLFRLSSDNGVSFARMDIAGDERDGYFTVDRLDKHIRLGKYATRCKQPSLTKYGREICYVGSAQSKVLMRIYNKKLERGYDPEDDNGKPWWRCELQLRDDYCMQFLEDWKAYGIGYAYSGHCKNHIRWLSKPNNKDNSQRISTAKWYDDFLGRCDKLKFTSKVGSSYNLSKLERYCTHVSGSSMVTLVTAFKMTPQQFYDYFMQNDNIKLRADQIDLLQRLGYDV